MKEEILNFVKYLFILAVLVGVMFCIHFLVTKYVPNIISKNYENQIQILEEKIKLAEDDDTKLYYKFQVIEKQDDFNIRAKNNFAEDRLYVLMIPFILFMICLVPTCDNLLDAVFAVIDEINEHKKIPTES